MPSPAEQRRRRQAQAILEMRRRQRAGEDLYHFVERVTPRYQAPVHLDPLVQLLERSWRGAVYATAHAPPRHGKTESVLAFAAQTLAKFPTKHVAYVTYAAELAREKSLRAKAIAQAAGVRFAFGQDKGERWATTEGGSFRAVGIGGPLTGAGVDLLIVDDPYKDRVAAESGAYRRRVIDWWNDVGNTRLEPGSSAFVFHTRWVVDDLIGHLHRVDGTTASGGRWDDVVMPAIDAHGRALWPGRWPVEALREKQRNEFTWASLYQGRPVPRGGALFKTPAYYDEVPGDGYDAIGLDLAYTAKTKSDYCVAVAVRSSGGKHYVLEVLRAQLRATDFLARLIELRGRYPKARVRMYAGGTEHGPVDFMNLAGAGIDYHPAVADKFVRALPTAEQWNGGGVLLPRGLLDAFGRPIPPAWRDDFEREVCGFTGVADAHDDQVDALAAASDELRDFDGDYSIY